MQCSHVGVMGRRDVWVEEERARIKNLELDYQSIEGQLGEGGKRGSEPETGWEGM